MKLFTNLPGNLRALFGLLRYLTLLLGVFWLLTLTFHTWIQKRFVDEPKLIVTVGEITLPKAAEAIELTAKDAKPGSMALQNLRGTLQMDLCSNDAAMVSALRWTMIPSMAVVIAFSWTLFSSLRHVCGNIECGEVFSDRNLRLVRSIGIILIAYSLAGGGLELWASYVMGGYFSQHVVLTGLKTSLQFPDGAGALQFNLSPGFLTSQGGLVTGCLVLVVAQAFRHGLNLKTENDLTV
jgi:hypothetical protein